MIVAAGVATVGALTLLGSHSRLLLLIAPLGGVAMVYAARRPQLAVTLMVVAEVTNVSGVLEQYANLPIFQASLLLGVLAVAFAVRDPRARQRLNRWTAVCAALLLVYLATQAVATVGSVDVAVSIFAMRRAVLDSVFIMVVLVLTQLTGRPWTVAAAIVIPLSAISLLTVIDQFVFGGAQSFGGFSTVTTASGEGVTTLRYGGPLPDSNFWGRHLVMGLPLAAALLTRALWAKRPPAIALWAVMILAQLAGVYLTQSRGTFLAAGVAVAAWFLASHRSIRRRGLLLIPMGLVFLLLPGVGNRLIDALSDVTQASENSNVDPSVLGRLAAQQEAWMMFETRPYFGFGPATFPGEVVNFAGRVSIAVREPTNAPHNLYAEVAAETGVWGLFGLAVLILGFLTVAALQIVRNPESRERVLAAAVCAAIVAWSVASIGLHMAYFRTFGVVLALAGGMAPAGAVPTAKVKEFLRGLAIWLVAVSVGAGAALLYLVAVSTPAVSATQRMTLFPVGPVDGDYSYALDIRSRAEMLPTFAAMLDDPGSGVDIAADPVRGLLTFTSTAEDRDAARDAIQRAVAHADSVLHASIGYHQYALQPIAGMTTEPSNERSPLAPLVALAIGAVTALVIRTALAGTRARRRTAQPDPPQRATTEELISV